MKEETAARISWHNGGYLANGFNISLTSFRQPSILPASEPAAGEEQTLRAGKRSPHLLRPSRRNLASNALPEILWAAAGFPHERRAGKRGVEARHQRVTEVLSFSPNWWWHRCRLWVRDP